MLFKTYGNTGKKISALAFGGMRFANPDDIDTNAAVVLHAYNKGVNYFDTAPGYCADKSEEIFGAAVRQMTPGTFYTSTKCMASDGDDLRKSLERSLERLGVDTVDFFHIWCIVKPEQWGRRKAGGAVAAAQKAKEEGLINHLVFSSHMTGDLISGMIDEGIFEGVTLGYCAINFPYRQKAVDAAHAAGLGVVTMNPLGGGVIPANAGRFDFIRGSDDPDVVAAAIRFNVSQPAITAALVGFTTCEHVDAAVAAVENFQPYPAAHVESIKEKITESFEGLCTGCGYCLPCPVGLEIPKLMDAYNQKILADENTLMGRLKWHWNVPADVAAGCTGCGACETACTQQLPIIERMADIVEIGERDKKKE